MKVRNKESGTVYEAVEWHPGVDHVDVLKENPPTRGQPQGSGTLRGGGVVLPGEYLLCTDNYERVLLRVLSESTSTWEDYEVAEDAPDPRKLCPLLQEDCREDGCMWWSDGGVCAALGLGR